MKTIENKKQLNKEIRDRFGNFKENCFPKPSGGCRCNEKDSSGRDIVRRYENEDDCKISKVCFHNYI